MRLLSIVLFLVPIFGSCSKTGDVTFANQTIVVDWNAAADSSSFALVNNFWNASGNYFNNNSNGDQTFNYWPQAHGLDVLVDAYTRTSDQLYLQYIDKWYTGVPAKNGGSFINEFYDDMEWNALAMLRAYDATQESKFKDATETVWTNIKSGWNTIAGGGIAWRKSQTYYKNTPANAPACILGARLYKHFNDQNDLDFARQIYQWLKSNLYDAGTGFVYDGMNRNNDGQKDAWQFTYNQGTFIGAAIELYSITKDPAYLNDATKAADFALNSETNNTDRILQDEGTGDGGLFKGVLVRYLTQLILVPDLPSATSKRYSTYLKHNAETLWVYGTNKSAVLFGTYWKNKPSTQSGLTEQLSGAMLIEAAALLNKNKMF